MVWYVRSLTAVPPAQSTPCARAHLLLVLLQDGCFNLKPSDELAVSWGHLR